MKEKLGMAMIFAVGLMVLILLIALFLPEFIEESADPTSFAKGIGAALVTCLAGVITAFKHDKRTVSKNEEE